MSLQRREPPPEAPDARPRILVVDDHLPNRDLLDRLLTRRGYDVILREDACSIEDDIVAERIDLVLLDWMMPNRSGLDALVGLRARYDVELLPIVVVTALSDGQMVAQALKAGANDYISKPIDHSILTARLRVQLDRRAAVMALNTIRDELESTVRSRTHDLTAANKSLLAEIGEREAAEERARAIALHDALTGLPNRRHLSTALADLLTDMSGATRLAVVTIDLDRFKPVNDLYGHSVGDELLVKVAKVLSDEAGAEGFAARLGGDEFVMVLPNTADDDLIVRLSAMLGRFDASFQLVRHEVTVGVSLGVAVAPVDGVDAEILLRRADIALYRAKQEGRGRFAFFEPGMDARVQERAILERDLRHAVRTDAIEPHFQPLVRLGTGSVFGYEILARWAHPERGFIQPEQFIALAVETGLIGDLTLNVLRRACRQALHWPGAPRLSVNIAPAQLRDQALVPKILQVLTETNFPPARLEIEITEEGLVSDFDDARRVLESFKNLGMQIALDDFGTGYSSLRHLRELPFDVLKIDRSFVLGMDDSDGAKIFIKTIIDMAKNLRLDVTAEGIETAAHAAALCAMGCDVGQGYFFGRPGARAADGGPTMAAPGPAGVEDMSRQVSQAAPEARRNLA